MQISKSLLLACAAAAAVCSTSHSLGADSEAQTKAREALRQKLAELDSIPRQDSEAQTKAREALRQKMTELDTQVAEPAKPVQPAPVTTRKAPAAASAAAQPAMMMPQRADSDAIMRAREALRKKMAELDSQSAPGGADTAEIARAREAMRQKMAELDQQQPTALSAAELQKRAAEEAKARKAQKAAEEQEAKAKAAATGTAAATSAPDKDRAAQAQMTEAEARKKAEAAAIAEAKQKEKEEEQAEDAERQAKKKVARGEFAPLSAPDMPLSAEKQQKLAELLKKYRADEITPEQYHSQRSKILAEP